MPSLNCAVALYRLRFSVLFYSDSWEASTQNTIWAAVATVVLRPPSATGNFPGLPPFACGSKIDTCGRNHRFRRNSQRLHSFHTIGSYVREIETTSTRT